VKAKLDRDFLRTIKAKSVTYDILDTEDRGFLARMTPACPPNQSTTN